MKKIEFMIGIMLRVSVLLYSIFQLIEAGDWGWIWDGIGYFSLAVIMSYSIVAQTVMLMKWTPSKNEYYQF